MSDIIVPEPGAPVEPSYSDVTQELRVMRQQTHEFIAWNSRLITLRWPGKVADGMGGWRTVEPTPALVPQIMRLITQMEGVTVVRSSLDGEEISPDFVLLGDYDAEILADDWFEIDGRIYDVKMVREDRRYETWAAVEYRG